MLSSPQPQRRRLIAGGGLKQTERARELGNISSRGRLELSRATSYLEPPQVISSGRDVSSRLKSLGSRIILSPLRLTRSAQDDLVRHETSYVPLDLVRDLELGLMWWSYEFV